MSAYAAIDCGTNSTRILIADSSGVQLERELRVTRLGQGVDATGMLSAAAIGRTLAALQEFRELADELGVNAIDAVATSAARDAGNGEEFFAAATTVLGVRPRLLSGEEEGRTTYSGATNGLPAGTYLVIDIGGGSTEFVLGRRSNATDGGPSTVQAISIDLGCVRMSERFLHSDPYSAAELESAFEAINAELGKVVSEFHLGAGDLTLVGVAGTVTSLASMDLGLLSYDPGRIHHYSLGRVAVQELFESLSRVTERDRSRLETMPPNRSDVIVAGAAILLASMRRLGLDRCVVSESDILDGLLSGLIARTAQRT